MKRLYRNISTVNAALQKTPKVFNSIRVNLPVNVSLRMVDNLVRVIIRKVIVRTKRVTVDRRTSFNVLSDFAVKRAALSVRDYHRSDLAVTLKQAHNSNLARSLVSSSARGGKLSYTPCQRRTVHIASL